MYNSIVIISLVKLMSPTSTSAFSIYLLPLLSHSSSYFFLFLLLTLSSFSPPSIFSLLSLYIPPLFPLSHFPPSTLVIDNETTMITCLIIKCHETLCFQLSLNCMIYFLQSCCTMLPSWTLAYQYLGRPTT